MTFIPAFGRTTFFLAILATGLTACIHGPVEPELISEPPAQTDHSGAHYVAGELLVRFREGMPTMEIHDLIRAQGMTVLTEYPRQNLYLIGLQPELSVEQAVWQFQGMPGVLWAEPNYIRSPREK